MRGISGTVMTAIDFTAFVDELAAISGETIRPFFGAPWASKIKAAPAGSIR